VHTLGEPRAIDIRRPNSIPKQVVALCRLGARKMTPELPVSGLLTVLGLVLARRAIDLSIFRLQNIWNALNPCCSGTRTWPSDVHLIPQYSTLLWRHLGAYPLRPWSWIQTIPSLEEPRMCPMDITRILSRCGDGMCICLHSSFSPTPHPAAAVCPSYFRFYSIGPILFH